MSELKVTTVYDAYWTANSVGEGTGIQVYLKDEADKVINELKAQKAQAEDDCAYWKMSEGNAANAMHETEEYAMQLYNELRHSNHKRCVAMYRYCAIKALYELDFKGNDVEWKWYSKWMHKWFELAEKFKEAK